MKKARALIKVLKTRCAAHLHYFFVDWERIVYLLFEIGKDLSFIVGFMLSKLSQKVNALATLLLNFQEGIKHGFVHVHLPALQSTPH
jgi:hypothetical protein